MAKTPTREQYIKRGRRLRTVAVAFFRLQSLVANKSGRQEIVMDTPFGKVRTLCYGLDNAPGFENARSPVYFDLHGGGFILGSAEMDHAMNRALHQETGYKIVSINYAKAPDAPYPAAVNQVYAVVEHVLENAGQYGVDPDRMAIGGHSAGGNLATVTCMRAKKEGRFGFVCQILDYPPLDLATDPHDKPRPRGAISPSMASMFNACYVDPARARDPYVSPVLATRQDLAGLPPALLILAGGDSLHDEGLVYREMLEAAGVTVECHEYPGAPHSFTYKSTPDALDARARMAAFLSRYFSK